MNHGLKVNGNILEITIPDNIHIDKVIVNRQIFSQRMQICESCKYHGLEGHEEPCVSCEVGNSNYVPSVEQEERTEERTETHACDCISRQEAIESLGEEPMVWNDEYHEIAEREQWRRDVAAIEAVPSAESKSDKGCKKRSYEVVDKQAFNKMIEDAKAEPQITYCKDCKYYCNVLYNGTQFERGKCCRTFTEDVNPDDYCSRGEQDG